MNRRHFLGTILGSGTLLGGCLQFRETATDSPTTPDEVAEFDFRVGWSDGREPLEKGHVHAADTVVERTADSPQLRVIGQLASGSRSCKETVLDALEYDHGTLTVAVLDEHVADPNEECTTELAVIGYRLLVTFENVLPTTVEVSHLGNDGFSETIAVQ